jgi:hypothetical protein
VERDPPSGAYLLVLTPPVELVPLEAKVTIGRAEGNHVVFPNDPAISRLHAVVETHGAGWSVRDLSRNGTFVNGERVVGEHALRPGDELAIGAKRLVLRGPADPPGETFEAERAPELTPTEKKVVLELCRPLLSEDDFPQPATLDEIAGRLNVSSDTVKSHLQHMYLKFDLVEPTRNRRLLLARAAIRRGAVSRADLRTDTR